jgi:hypothetical protein
MMTRVCVYCGAEFHPHGWQKQCRAPACERQRRVETGGRWRKRNPEANRQKAIEQGKRRNERRATDPAYREHLLALSRARYIRRREAGPMVFKITSRQHYEELFEAQGGVCAICKRPERLTQQGRLKRLAIDHDAETGKVRGLLCAACNLAIGHLQHDPARVLAAADYLNSHVAPESSIAAMAVLDEAMKR